jgi:hypothetical protein
MRFELGLLNDIFSILNVGGHPEEKGFQFFLKGIEFYR